MKQNTFLPIVIIFSAVIISAAVLYDGTHRGAESNAAELAGSNTVGGTGHKVQVRITETDPSVGNPGAPVTLIEFGDFECPFCQRFSAETMPLLIQREIKEGKVRIVWKDFPLSIHSYAQKAHEAGRCAWEQDKFWEYHDVLFANQRKLGINDLKRYAKELNLNENQFTTCLDSGKYTALIREKVQEGITAGVSGTPSFLVNGTIVVGAQPYQVFADAIARAEQELVN